MFEDFEFEDKYNPWIDGVSSLEHFRYYCCPQCDDRVFSKSDFIKHALDTHPKSKALIDTLDIDKSSASNNQETRKRPNEEEPIFAPKILKVEPETEPDHSNDNSTEDNNQNSSDNIENPIPSTSGLQKKKQTIQNDANSEIQNNANKAVTEETDNLRSQAGSQDLLSEENSQDSDTDSNVSDSVTSNEEIVTDNSHNLPSDPVLNYKMNDELMTKENNQNASDNIEIPIPSTSDLQKKNQSSQNAANSDIQSNANKTVTKETSNSMRTSKENAKDPVPDLKDPPQICKYFFEIVISGVQESNKDEVAKRNVIRLIQLLIDGEIDVKTFTSDIYISYGLTEPRIPFPKGSFLQQNIQSLRTALFTGDLSINGIRPPKKLVRPRPLKKL